MDGVNKEDREMNQNLLNRECRTLLNEVKRLDSQLTTQEKRLKNVMGLVSYKSSFVPILSSIVVRGYRYLAASI